MKSGFSNWSEVSLALKGKKTPQECEDHYISLYCQTAQEKKNLPLPCGLENKWIISDKGEIDMGLMCKNASRYTEVASSHKKEKDVLWQEFASQKGAPPPSSTIAYSNQSTQGFILKR